MILQPIASPYTDYTIPVAIYMNLMQQNYIGVSTVTKRDMKFLPSIFTREIIVLRPLGCQAIERNKRHLK